MKKLQIQSAQNNYKDEPAMKKLGPAILKEIEEDEKELDMTSGDKTARALGEIENVKDSEDPDSFSSSDEGKRGGA